MPQITKDDLLNSQHPYSIKSVEGHSYLTKRVVANAGEIAVGDRVSILSLPDGRYYLEKTDEGEIAVEKVTLSHIFFEKTMTLEDADELLEKG